MALPPLQPISAALVDNNGRPSLAFGQYLLAMDQIVRGLTGGSYGLTNAANDTAAASAGVQVGQLYRNGNAVQIRLT